MNRRTFLMSASALAVAGCAPSTSDDTDEIFERVRGGLLLVGVPKDYDNRYFFLIQNDQLTFGDVLRPDNRKNNVYTKLGYQFGSQVVIDGLVDIRFDFVMVCRRADGGVTLDARMRPIQHPTPAELVDGAILCSRHEPRTGIVWDTGLRPTLECRDERFLSKILGEAEIAHDADETEKRRAARREPGRGTRCVTVTDSGNSTAPASIGWPCSAT